MDCSTGFELRHQIAPTIRRAARADEMSQANASRVFFPSARGAVPLVAPPLSAIQLSSLDRSSALCQRWSGSLAKHFLTRRSSAGGVIGCKTDMGCGSEERMAAIKLARLFPANAGLPVAISY